MPRKLSVIVVLIAFLFSFLNPLYAGSLFSNLPAPGSPVQTSPAFKPIMLQGIKLDPKNPLHLDFIIDPGDANSSPQTLRTETLKLVRYFLASLTVPNDQLWVNLSPYEKNRIIPDGLALTEMGGELLAQDYMLKQLTASLMGPEQIAGKQFWAKYGNARIPLDIFNKIWIVPDRATIEEHHGTAVITDSHLKVMLEQDYLALKKNHQLAQDSGSMASDLIRQVVLPQIEREVNTGKNFAGVRQVNNALILAAWFKQSLKRSFLGQEYANQNKVRGIDLQDRLVKQKIYAQYLKAFKKGVYNYIKEGIDPQSQLVVARKYFLGGYNAKYLRLKVQEGTPAQISVILEGHHDLLASIDLSMMSDKVSTEKLSAEDRLSEIRESGYHGFPLVQQDKDIPVGIQYAMAYYDQIPGLAVNPVRELIRAGRLRAGPDLSCSIKGVPNEGGFLVSTDSENEADQVLINLVSDGKDLEGFIDWKKKLRKEANRPLMIHTSGVIAKPMEVLERYGILKLLKDNKTVHMQDIVRHVKKANPQYIAAVLRALASLGWLTMQGESADEVEISITPQGKEAFEFADRYAEVADFMPEFSKIPDYLFNRENAPPLKKGSLTLRELAEKSKQGWDIPGTTDPKLAELIKGQLDGYLVTNLALALNQHQGTVPRSKFSGIDSIHHSILDPDNIYGIWKAVSPTELRLRPLAELEGILKRAGYATLEDAVSDIAKGDDLEKYEAILKQARQDKILDLFDDNLEISLDNFAHQKEMKGDRGELKAAFDIFVNVGFLVDLGEGKYKLTQQGLAAFDRVLSYGVPISYRPSYDLSEQFLFGDAKSIKRLDENDRELLVYRYLNVLGSGASHATYFKQVDKIVKKMIEDRLNDRKNPNAIPLPGELTEDEPFVLSFADTGSGDGTFLAHLYHVIMDTGYGKLVSQYPKLYKVDMVGVDYNPEAQFATSERLLAQNIEHIVMFGNINDPKQIVTDVKKDLIKKYGRDAKLMVIHTRTFLDHNRPWKEVENQEQSDGRTSTLSSTYGWRSDSISKKDIEQNLYEHYKAWADALRAEGQNDLIVIELHTIPPELAAKRIGETLDVPYWLSHAFSDQFITEYSVYKARVEEAGFVGVSNSNKLYPDAEGPTVSIDQWQLSAVNSAMAAKATHVDMPVTSLSPFGGINLDPDLGFVQIERDVHGEELPPEIGALQGITLKGIEPILIKIIALSGQSLLDE